MRRRLQLMLGCWRSVTWWNITKLANPFHCLFVNSRWNCRRLPIGGIPLFAERFKSRFVPVLEDDDGTVVVESRAICERLIERHGGSGLVPPPFEGPVWAYADFNDGPLEDILFRVGSPSVRLAWQSPSDRALYVLVKERKFGAGCVDAWLRDREVLLERARHLLAPTLRTLEQTPFLFGNAPTLADAALYGNCIQLEEAEPAVLARLAPTLVDYVRRVEARAPLRGVGSGPSGEANSAKRG